MDEKLGLIAYNILRMIGQGTIGGRAPRQKRDVKRRRVHTVISNLVMMASHVTTHARQLVMGLGKGAYAIHQSGKWYTNENIDQMLMERHLNKKARRGSHKNHLKGPKKRTEEDDKRFAQSFEKLVLMARTQEGD